ncbi:MAG: OmpA family protein, partial [Mariprofundaceae bacterium]|nr:OmpA family protein [Mariprofundaceae bacterium]
SGVRIYLEDGTFTVTDEDGFYHFNGLKVGRHVVQLDTDSLSNRYQIIGLKNNRFAGNAFSQFVDLKGGVLWRSNFRVLQRVLGRMPVTISQGIKQEGQQQWVTLKVEHNQKVPLSALTAHYELPDGWTLIANSPLLNGQSIETEQKKQLLNWQLDPTQSQHKIRFAMQGGGKAGHKTAKAFAGFVSAGSPQGQTDVATIKLQDTLDQQSNEQSHSLQLHFISAKNGLAAESFTPLKNFAQTLKSKDIQRITVEGHTDNRKLSQHSQHSFGDNQALSSARAQFVADYLKTALKLTTSQILIVGKGEREPIASNESADGRAKNRRVVIRITSGKTSQTRQTEIGNSHSQATGHAQNQWDDEAKKATIQTKMPKNTLNFVSLQHNSSLPHRIGSVQIHLDSRLKPQLNLDGQEIPSDKIGFKQKNPKTKKTIYTYIGINFGEVGKHELHLQGKDPFGNNRVDEKITLIRTGEVADIRLLEAPKTSADGITPIRLRLQLKDHTGAVLTGSTELEYRGGDLNLVSQNKLLLATNPSKNTRVLVDTDGWITLAPSSKSGVHHIILGYNDVQRDIEVFIKPAYRDWILVGFGEGTLGYNTLNGAAQPIHNKKDKLGFYKDGKLAFYAKGRVNGNYLLTMAYDTSKSRKNNSLHQSIDPNQFYTLYGDASEQQYDASSQRKLYLKIEKDAFYALFGDFETGLSTTELARYSRHLNGLKSEYRGERVGYSAFATQTSKTLAKDEIRGDGTSGLYHLSRHNITLNSERISIETRDRFKSNVILEARQLTRHLDYNIDYNAGTIYFKQPIASKDNNLNPIYIRIEYESDTLSNQFTTFGGRASVKALSKLEVGGTYVQQAKLGKNDQLKGIDATLTLNEQTEFTAEAAQTDTQAAKANAYKAEARYLGKQLSARTYFRQVDDNFGLGQITGSENATRKVGADAELRLSTESKILTEVYRQQTLNTQARRDAANIQWVQQIAQHSLRAGLRHSHDQDGAGNTFTSQLITAGVSSQLTDKWSVRMDREQNTTQTPSSDFPTRTTIGSEYQISTNTLLSATHEWAQSQQQQSNATRLGVRTQPWAGAQLSTNYEQQLSEAGIRSFANIGVQQQWLLDEALSLTLALDRNHTLKKPGLSPLNLNVPLSSGGADFSAVSLGMNYRPETWAFTSQVEYHHAANQQKWNIVGGVMGDPAQNLSTMMNVQWLRDVQRQGSSSTQANMALAMAYRPDYDGLTVLNRFDVRYLSQQILQNKTVNWRYVNNLSLNWQATPRWQFALHYGEKWARETIAQQHYSGFTDLVALHTTYDINEKWDISAQAGLLHTWKTGQYASSAGLSVGYRLMKNTWIGVGYNVTGFSDSDFQASSFTKKGPFIQIRFKFDQHSLAEMLKH